MGQKKKKQKNKKRKSAETSTQKPIGTIKSRSLGEKLRRLGIPSFFIAIILFCLYLFGWSEVDNRQKLYEEVQVETNKIEQQIFPFFRDDKEFLIHIPNAMQTGEVENYLKQYITSLHHTIKKMPKSLFKYQELFPFAENQLKKWESLLDVNIKKFTDEFPEYASLEPAKANFAQDDPLEIRSYAWIAYIKIRSHVDKIRKLDEKIKTIRK